MAKVLLIVLTCTLLRAVNCVTELISRIERLSSQKTVISFAKNNQKTEIHVRPSFSRSVASEVTSLLATRSPSQNWYPGLTIESDMKFEVGKPIAVQLTDGRSLRGFVHAEDKGAGILCLELIPSAETALLPTVNIKTVSIISERVPVRRWPANPTVDVAKVKADEDRILSKSENEFKLLGVGVSASAQAIFDTLSKTYPCKWDRDEIVVLDTARLAPPYDAKSISGDPGTVERVKIILQRGASAIKTATNANGVKP